MPNLVLDLEEIKNQEVHLSDFPRSLGIVTILHTATHIIICVRSYNNKQNNDRQLHTSKYMVNHS